jgi:hypothetical protein
MSDPVAISGNACPDGSRYDDDALETSVLGLGCVKTRKLNLWIEISSLLRRFEKAKALTTASGEDNRENNSAASSRSHVFTQPRSIGEELSLSITRPLTPRLPTLERKSRTASYVP